MKLTVKDKNLLYWLDQNSRATNKELGKRIALSEQGVGYKLKVLENKGIIKKYVTFVNTLSLGYSHYKILLRLQNTSPEEEKKLINHLIKNQHVRWVVSCSGRWDINFSIMAKSPSDFLEIYQKIEQKFSETIAEKNISLLINSPGFTRGYLISQKSEKVLDYKPEMKLVDATDKKILKSISQDARKSIRDIAAELDITPDIVRYRINKFTKEKIISGFTIQLDYEKMNLQRYSVFFSLHNMNKDVEMKMLEFAKVHNNIVFLLTLIGTYDKSLEIEIESYTQLENVLKKFRSTFSEHITNFEIVYNTHEYKFDFYPFS